MPKWQANGMQCRLISGGPENFLYGVLNNKASNDAQNHGVLICHFFFFSPVPQKNMAKEKTSGVPARTTTTLWVAPPLRPINNYCLKTKQTNLSFQDKKPKFRWQKVPISTKEHSTHLVLDLWSAKSVRQGNLGKCHPNKENLNNLLQNQASNPI